ncbi:uncharacterized protein [Oscarella lobularis]|uniref:uncharacterized protein n=1 Tax=Oscarella lobularis TaxID=121494 RepID=UPI0033144333
MSSRVLVCFGEAMIRYQPVDGKSAESQPSLFLRSVGGDELNVCVAQSKLGRKTRWISVLPTGPMGRVITDCEKNVDFSDVVFVDNADLGTYTVLPELKTVHYQRRNSAFAKHDPSVFNWTDLLSKTEEMWLHMTGITPMISELAFESWNKALSEAHRRNIPTSLDFNHRKQLGTLEKLWSYVKPHLPHLQVVVLSLLSMQELADLEGVVRPQSDTPESDPAWPRLMQTLRSKWELKRLACCFKAVDKTGLQTRWSVLATESGTFTTHGTPILHRPVDALGGGSAWMAGLLDSFMDADVSTMDVTSALRHADLLAALCQETAGDHSTVTRSQLSQVEERFAKRAVDLAKLQINSENEAQICSTLQHLHDAGVIAILRAKNPDVAIERGLELASMGCRALEITTDATDCVRVIQKLRDKLPSSCILGVGTVMEAEQVSSFAALGVKFALSPIAPSGFINACHNHGIVAVPSGFTSNELWSLHQQGARMIKLFSAQQFSPSLLKSMLSVGPLKNMNISPSGGIGPHNAQDWWDAGARVLAMGSNLVGKDINFATGSSEYVKAREDWETVGRVAAKNLFETAAQRSGKA